MNSVDFRSMERQDYFHTEERIKQMVDFSSNARGASNNIIGCDFDYVCQYGWGSYAVFGDLKSKGPTLDRYLSLALRKGGAKMAYTDTVDRWNYDPEKKAIYITIEHNTNPNEKIDIRDCYVREIYSTDFHKVFSEDKKYSVNYIENIFGYMYDIKDIIESPSYKVEWGTILPEDLW